MDSQELAVATQEVVRVPRPDQSTRRRGNHYMWFLPGNQVRTMNHGLGAEGAIVLADPVWGFQGCALLEGWRAVSRLVTRHCLPASPRLIDISWTSIFSSFTSNSTLTLTLGDSKRLANRPELNGQYK